MHLRPSNSLRRSSSTSYSGSSTTSTAPTAPAARAAPIHKKKKPQTWLRNSLLRESEKQANRKGRPQKYLQNVPREVFQRRGPPDTPAAGPVLADTSAPAKAQDVPTQQLSTEAMSAVSGLQSTAQHVQQQLAGTQIPQQLVSSWPHGLAAGGHGAGSLPPLAPGCAPLQLAPQPQHATWGLQRQVLTAPMLPSVSGNSSDSTVSAYMPVQQQQVQLQVQQQLIQGELLQQPSSPLAMQSCCESSSSRHSSVPPQPFGQQVSLVAALCGIYTSTVSEASSTSQQPIGSAQTTPAPVPAKSSSCIGVWAGAATVSPAAAEYRGCITTGYEQFKHDAGGPTGSDVPEGLGNIEQLVEEATGWDGDMLTCLLEPGTDCLGQGVSDSWDSLASPILPDVLPAPQVDALDSWGACLSDVELSDGGWGPAMFLE